MSREVKCPNVTSKSNSEGRRINYYESFFNLHHDSLIVGGFICGEWVLLMKTAMSRFQSNIYFAENSF